MPTVNSPWLFACVAGSSRNTTPLTSGSGALGNVGQDGGKGFQELLQTFPRDSHMPDQGMTVTNKDIDFGSWSEPTSFTEFKFQTQHLSPARCEPHKRQDYFVVLKTSQSAEI
jgi:hypothetical protein